MSSTIVPLLTSGASPLVKWLALLLLALALALAVVGLTSRDTLLHRAYFRHLAKLQRHLRILFLEVSATHIAIAQASALVLGVALAAALGQPLFLTLSLAAATGPTFVLEKMRKTRVAQIEAKLDSFVVALANALRASPSPGRALAMIHPITPAPLDQEIELVLREMRVGSTLEQALGNMSARVQSFQLDAAMSGLLIGRQTGGNVPHILDSAAQTLREMARLQGVLRTKTAEARTQTKVMAIFPLFLIFAFDYARPGYFKPLTESAAGIVVMTLAIGMWLSAVLMTRKIMAVEL